MEKDLLEPVFVVEHGLAEVNQRRVNDRAQIPLLGRFEPHLHDGLEVLELEVYIRVWGQDPGVHVLMHAYLPLL